MSEVLKPGCLQQVVPAGLPRSGFDVNFPDNVGIRLADYTPAYEQHSRLEPTLGRLQGRLRVIRRRLLARSGKHAPSHQLAPLPTVGPVLTG